MADKHSTERLRILMVRSGGNNILFGLLLLLMNGANPIPVSFYYQQADKHSTEPTTVTVSKRKEKNIAKHVSPWSSCCAFLLVQPATTHSDGRE
jgi:hypothetical protein